MSVICQANFSWHIHSNRKFPKVCSGRLPALESKGHILKIQILGLHSQIKILHEIRNHFLNFYDLETQQSEPQQTGSGKLHFSQVPHLFLMGIPFWESLIRVIQGSQRMRKWRNKQKLILCMFVTKQEKEYVKVIQSTGEVIN